MTRRNEYINYLRRFALSLTEDTAAETPMSYDVWLDAESEYHRLKDLTFNSAFDPSVLVALSKVEKQLKRN